MASRPDGGDVPTDTALRANVRLLGEILGRVLVEQVGEELFELEERIRFQARLGRRGDEGAARALRETIAALPIAQQATVLRAFTFYFHLANIAEQHHRVRRRREVEQEGHTLRESLTEAIALLRASGVSDEELRATADARHGRAGPHRAPDRGPTADDPGEAPPVGSCSAGSTIPG